MMSQYNFAFGTNIVILLYIISQFLYIFKRQKDNIKLLVYEQGVFTSFCIILRINIPTADIPKAILRITINTGAPPKRDLDHLLCFDYFKRRDLPNVKNVDRPVSVYVETFI